MTSHTDALCSGFEEWGIGSDGLTAGSLGHFENNVSSDTKRKAAVPRKRATAGKQASKPERKAGAPHAESKGANILALIRRPKGATLAEIMKATDWQAHSLRGFISTAGEKRGVKIESTKNEAGDRVYRSDFTCANSGIQPPNGGL